jgi:hypothetical protein
MADPYVTDVIAASIASGQNLSGEIDLGGKSLVGIEVPANWTTAAISLQASPDGGVTWCELVDQTATAIGCSSLAGGTLVYFVAVDPTKLRGVRSIKIRSGTQATPVTQANTVALSVLVRFAI